MSEQQLQQLEDVRSETATGLISVFVPADTEMCHVTQKLTKEVNAANNIKDPRNRRSVQRALNILMPQIKNLKNSGSTGTALFVGQCI